MAAADAEDDDVPCAYCSRQRALLHCAQHGGARLCLPCDLRLHAAAAPGRHGHGHERTPLCDRCHAAPAAARCADHRHRALLCAPCCRAAGCDADGHATRPAQAYTGCPAPAELARILSWDAADATPPPAPPSLSPPLPEPPPDTWVPDLVNIELLPDLLPSSSSSSWRDGNITSELLSGGNFEGPVAGSSGALQIGDGDDELFMNEDWPNLDDAGLDDFNFIMHDSDNLTTNSINLTGQREGTLEASTSLGYDHPLIASCSEPIIASTDAVLESLASNNAAYHQFSSVATTANMSGNVGGSSELLPHGNTFYASGMAPMLTGDEFPSTNFGFEVKPPALVAVSSPIGSYQDQEVALLASSAHEQQASSHDMEARTKQQEKRQEAKQRYKDKKKNRRFGKQIMYVSRKVRADTRNRVKGRFAKAASGSGIQGEDQSTQHGDDQPTNEIKFLASF